MNYLTSSFSLQMIPNGGHLEISRIDSIIIREWVDRIVIGHEGTAQILSKMLGVPIKVDRTPITLQVGDKVQVAQLAGNRLMPGSEIQEPDLACFFISVNPEHKCRTLDSYCEDELEAALERKRLQIEE